MAESNAEKQRRWRQRHLGHGGSRERLDCVITISAKRNFDRLACYYGFTKAKLLEMLVGKHSRALLSKLSLKEQERFYQESCGFNPAQRIVVTDWDKNCFYARQTSTTSEADLLLVEDDTADVQ